MNPSRSIAALLWFAALQAVAASQTAAAVPPQEPSPDAPPASLGDAFRIARLRMRTDKAPGLVFLLPPAEAMAAPAAVEAARQAFPTKMGGAPVAATTARELLLLQLQVLRNPPAQRPDAPATGAATDAAAAALPLLFGLAVPVVVIGADCGAHADETIVLLSPEGQRLAGFRVDLGDRAAVAAALAPHLLDRDALAARQANVPPVLQQALGELRALRQAQHAGELSEVQQRRLGELQAQMQQRLFAVAPALVEIDAEGAHADPLLTGLLEWTTPLGTAVGETWDPCPPCGMAAMPLPMRSALRLLAQ